MRDTTGQQNLERGFRPDLQGLRAVAVLLVVLDHAGVGFLKGGYVGVDVFFVLSGFLITRLLLADAFARGRVSLSDFYARRARRILPAATLTLAATTVAAFELLNYVRAKQVAWDGFWAALFAANVRFAHEGTNYFAQGQPPSSVQHYWSLAVEEQFYLVWPAVMSLTLFGVLFGRRVVPRPFRRSTRPANPARSRRRLLAVITIAGAASLAWSIHMTSAAPVAAYFSTRARAWELALGAILATGQAGLRRVPGLALDVAGWIGLGAIATAAIAFTATTPFPGYAALLPTLGTVLVIAAGVAHESRLGVGGLLAVAPMRYVGDRSYTFYLWHWPFLVIASLRVGHDLGVWMNLLLLLAAFALSVVTYRWFENPIRHARWKLRSSLALVPVSLAGVIAITMAAVLWINSKALHLQVSNAAAATAAVDRLKQASASPATVKPLPTIVAAVKAAERGARIPPNLNPPPSAFLQDAYQFPDGCAAQDAPQTSSTICHLGTTSATKSIVVLGDSHAQMWMPTILAMAQADGWDVIPLAKSGCVVSAWVGHGYPGTPQVTLNQCHTWFRWAIRQAELLHPDVVLMAGCCGDASGSTLAAMKAAYGSAARALEPVSKSVIQIADDDGIAKNPTDCLLARHATLKTCLTTATSETFAGNDALRSLAATRGYGYLQTRGWFCSGFECPMVVGRTVVYRDSGHITQAYALQLAVPFRAAFRRCIFGACS